MMSTARVVSQEVSALGAAELETLIQRVVREEVRWAFGGLGFRAKESRRGASLSLEVR
jgi:hypothetical protein